MQTHIDAKIPTRGGDIKREKNVLTFFLKFIQFFWAENIGK